MKNPKFQRPTGMPDILPEDQIFFQKILTVGQKVAQFYGFKKIDTPILEETQLFVKGTGRSTDIVQKQMFNLKTKGGDFLTLRPEFTPGIVRAFIEHGMFNLPQPVKLYSFGPLFRYERSQAGRYRQFHQFNLEVLGEKSPIIDVEIIHIFSNILKELRLKNLVVQINSLGDNQCRPYYKKTLVSFFRAQSSSLCSDCQRRLRENPLRILDCKEEKCQRIISQAPQILDHLCSECHSHFKEVLEILDELQISYQLNPHLVRGLDYYTKTVFEIFSGELEEKNQGALVGGGRYDLLVKFLGGKETPAIGGALGLERVTNLLKMKIKKIPLTPQPKIFLAQLGSLAQRKSLKIFEEFYQAKLPLAEAFGRQSLKAQLKQADRIGACYTLILGQKEVLDGTIIIRDMKTGKQETVNLNNVVREMKRRLKKK